MYGLYCGPMPCRQPTPPGSCCSGCSAWRPVAPRSPRGPGAHAPQARGCRAPARHSGSLSARGLVLRQVANYFPDTSIARRKSVPETSHERNTEQNLMFDVGRPPLCVPWGLDRAGHWGGPVSCGRRDPAHCTLFHQVQYPSPMHCVAGCSCMHIVSTVPLTQCTRQVTCLNVVPRKKHGPCWTLAHSATPGWHKQQKEKHTKIHE